MSTQAHTPGPWELDDEDQVCGSNKVVASVEWRGPLSKEEIAANARLIAAAPEMLDILQTIIANAELGADPRMNATTDCYLVSIDDIDTARAAIRKAEGAQ